MLCFTLLTDCTIMDTTAAHSPNFTIAVVMNCLIGKVKYLIYDKQSNGPLHISKKNICILVEFFSIWIRRVHFLFLENLEDLLGYNEVNPQRINTLMKEFKRDVQKAFIKCFVMNKSNDLINYLLFKSIIICLNLFRIIILIL
jgi:hypothetical protein